MKKFVAIVMAVSFCSALSATEVEKVTIKDKVNGIDIVFGYGEYDFNTPNFYTKFAQGKLNYLMGLDSYQRFYKRYVYQNRTIREQILNFSQTEKQDLFDYLSLNYKPENRAYLYDFFSLPYSYFVRFDPHHKVLQKLLLLLHEVHYLE